MSVIDLHKDPTRSLAECAHEYTQDVAAIGKQVLNFMLDRSKRTDKESLQDLLELLELKLEQLKELVELSPQYRERAELIKELEKCVESRDATIQTYADNIKGAEQILTHGIFHANKKLRRVAEANANRVYSEEVLKFAHQISKGYSIAAPLYWQIGDPARPFPTEHEMRLSSLSGCRPAENTRTEAVGLGISRSPALPPRVGCSPGVSSPRTSYSTNSQSPRGRPSVVGAATPSGSSTGDQTPWRAAESPFTKRNESSPRRPVISSVPAPEQMSSDSSSSSSSDDES